MDFTGTLLNEYSSLPAYWWLWLIVVALVVWLIDGRRITPRPLLVTNPEAKGLRHFCLVVEDLDEVVKSVQCEEIRTDWFGRRFTFCRDYDGQPIELKEKKCGGPHE